MDREPRPVEIERISIEEFAPGDYPEAVLSVRCGKGTYVRVLADDIAAALGVGPTSVGCAGPRWARSQPTATPLRWTTW